MERGNLKGHTFGLQIMSMRRQKREKFSYNKPFNINECQPIPSGAIPGGGERETQNLKPKIQPSIYPATYRRQGQSSLVVPNRRQKFYFVGPTVL
jgi:hypothetical protein